MREIKFRAWYGGEMSFSDDMSLEYFFAEFENNDVMQYTGLKDKNGKEWFESDLVEAPSGNVFETIWNEDEMGWKLRDKNGVIYNINAPLYEVIGNIYEHPHLLEGE